MKASKMPQAKAKRKKLPDCCDFGEAFFDAEGEHDYDAALRLMCEKFGITVAQGDALLVEYDSLNNGNV